MRLSILIPTYNDPCLQLVEELKRQGDLLVEEAEATESVFDYEIIVADDASTDLVTEALNSRVADLAKCRYLRIRENQGRARIRNLLACKSRYEWLLFIDSDLVVPDGQYLANYKKVLHTTECPVVYGGTCIGGEEKLLKGNLRYRYEKHAEPQKKAIDRSQRPWQELSVCNCLVRRDVALGHPFDSRFRAYGYEDVLFGKRLAESGISIAHVDNPLRIDIFETNKAFLQKTEQAIQTLVNFEDDLAGYSNLARAARNITRRLPAFLVRLWHFLAGPLERRLLSSRHPSLHVFNLYKLGYYLKLKK